MLIFKIGTINQLQAFYLLYTKYFILLYELV